MQRSNRTHSRWNERGATAVFVALTIALLAAFLGLVINVGHLFSVKSELQNGADSGALAGAHVLDFTVAALQTATDDAQTYTKYHSTDTTNTIFGDPIELGHWPVVGEANVCADGEVATGTEQPPNNTKFCLITARDAAAAARINAVRVAASRANGKAGGGDAPNFINGTIGAAASTAVRTEAVAACGGPCSNACGDLPFVVHKACVGGVCPDMAPHYFYVALANDTTDNTGLTNLVPAAGVSSSDLCQILANPTTYCANNGNPDATLNNGDQIYTSNGAQWGAVCSTGLSLCDTIRSRVNSDTPSHIPVITYPDDPNYPTCEGIKYNQRATIDGFVTMKVVYVQCHKNNDTATVDVSLTPAQQQNFNDTCYSKALGTTGNVQACVVVQLLCGQYDRNNAGPCAYYGTLGRPRLVR